MQILTYLHVFCSRQENINKYFFMCPEFYVIFFITFIVDSTLILLVTWVTQVTLCSLSSSVVVRHVHRPLTILYFNFFTNLTIVTDFDVKHFYGESKVNCHTHGFTNPEPQSRGQICKNCQFLKKSLFLLGDKN